jgi:hypothetical protein
MAMLKAAPAFGQVPHRGPSIAALVGVEYIDKPYEVRFGAALAVPIVGRIDLYPSLFRYVDPVADYDEVWQLETSLRVRLTNGAGPALPYLGAGIAVQPAFAPLPGPAPEESVRTNVFTVLLAGIEFFPRGIARPIIELHVLGTGADGFSGYGRGEVSVLAGLSIRLTGARARSS